MKKLYKLWVLTKNTIKQGGDAWAFSLHNKRGTYDKTVASL